MPRAGHGCAVKVVGTSIATTGATTTCLDAPTYSKYRVSTSARRTIDPSQELVVYVDDAPVASTTFKVDYANAIVKFTTPLLVGNVVTLDYYYWPMLTITEATDFSISLDNGLLDKTSFDTSGARSRMAGVQDASGSISHLTLGSDDLDSGAGTRKLHDVLQNAEMVVLEFSFDGTAEGEKFRVLGGLESVTDKGSVDGLITEELAWKAGLGKSSTIPDNTLCLFGFDDGRSI